MGRPTSSPFIGALPAKPAGTDGSCPSPSGPVGTEHRGESIR